MSKFIIDIDYDDSAIQAAFARLLKAGRSLYPVFVDVGKYLLKEHEQLWKAGVGRTPHPLG